MAKKNKKNIKLNQQIRKYFDSDPFDVGIERVPAQILSELFATLGIYDIVHSHELMVKTLRMIWSEADSSIRKDIVTFFVNNGVIYKKPKAQKTTQQIKSKLEACLEQLVLTNDELIALRDAFSTFRSNKITCTKVENKLAHIRFEAKKRLLEEELEGYFDLDERFVFHSAIIYEIFDQSFHKIEVVSTQPYTYEYLNEHDIQEIIQKVTQDKQKAHQQRQQQRDQFIQMIPYPHPYMKQYEIIDSLRTAPPEATTRYPMIGKKVLKKVLQGKLPDTTLSFHADDLLFEKQEQIVLPYNNYTLPYTLEFSVPLDTLLQRLWFGKKLHLEEFFQRAKEEYEKDFLDDVDNIITTAMEYAQQLHLTQEQVAHKIYPIMEDLLLGELHITPKIFKKVTRRFLYSIQEQIAQKQREELLARTIRDFKSLFPVARSLRRKLTLHIGPTNSGKTYTAMQKLKEADTGYYLAPLRLLALEGYETLQSAGLETSLITGEEQIIDEEATHISSTIEMMNYEVDVDVCVIDEVQMLDERDRGWAWVNAIIGAPAQEVIMTGSINVKDAVIALAEYLAEELEIVEFERKNELTLLENPTRFEDVQPGSAIITFSRKDVLSLKQRFSKQFDVSVVYGNLSPEVRKEEARRFREHESQILIATDAIAMGMNLPIKTVLFAKARKFDGVMDRDLFASEVHQIAGRAGRYGMHEEGYVGALHRDALRVVRKKFAQEPKKIEAPFKVMASLEHIKLVANILHEHSLEAILKFFIKNMEFNGPFYAASLDDMLLAAQIVDGYDLDIATKYHLACAPLTLKSPYIINAYEEYIQKLQNKEIVPYEIPHLHKEFATTAQELLIVEDMVKEISLYLWLSYRFGEYFVDSEKAREYRSVLNKYIERSLHETHLARSCRLCGAALPEQSNYAICQKCFKKNYRKRR